MERMRPRDSQLLSPPPTPHPQRVAFLHWSLIAEGSRQDMAAWQHLPPAALLPLVSSLPNQAPKFAPSAAFLPPPAPRQSPPAKATLASLSLLPTLSA